MNITNPGVFNTNVVTPFSNVDSRYVNIDGSNDPANFTSKATGVEFGLPRIVYNVDAANASIMSGGRRRGVSKKSHKYNKKTLKRKIKNIVNKYKRMKGGKKMTLGSLKKRMTKMYKKKSKRARSCKGGKKSCGSYGGKKGWGGRRTKRRYRGGQGYDQFLNNVPYTPSYSTGSINLPASESALANPVPYQPMNNCVDNYNHFTGKGMSS